MSKHLKTFLIVTVSIFSFLFIDNIKAWTYLPDFEYNDAIYNKVNNLTEENIYKLLENNGYNPDDYYYIAMYTDGSNFSNASYNTFAILYYPKTSKLNMNVTDTSSGAKFSFNSSNVLCPFYTNNHTSNTITLDTSAKINSSGYNMYLNNVSYLWYLSNNDVNDYIHDTSNKIYNINFHLNGGTINDKLNEIIFDDDFIVSLYQNEIENFIKNLEFYKDGMNFEGMYYDNSYNNPFSIDDFINSDIDLYIKWTFASVDDFLKNVSFNEHIFDTNYEYAIISKGNHNDDIYFGLDFANYSLEIFEYRPDLNNYKDGSSVCLTPIYSKDGKYYYNVNTLYTSNYEIFVLPRSIFDNNIESDYSFLLTDNAYVTYTNDLKDTVIIDKNGNELHTNLKDSYELSQSYLNEYKNADSNFNIMKKYLNELKSINSVWNECFDLFYSSLPTICKSFLIFVFNVIMILIFLKLVGWK